MNPIYSIFSFLFLYNFIGGCGGGSKTPVDNLAIGESTMVEETLETALPRGIISTSGKRKPVSQTILDNPNITGFMVLDGWSDIEFSEGVYDWTHIDMEVARAKVAGKVVRLAIHAGGDSAPKWIFENYPEVNQVIWYNKTTEATEWLPAYWDSSYVEIKNRFYQAVGERYKDEASIFAFSVSMIDPNTGDWTFAVETDEQLQSYLDSGFSETVFINAYKNLLDNAMAVFGSKYVVTAVGPIPRQLVSDSYDAVHQVLDYAYTSYGEKLIIAKGSLNAATPSPAELIANNPWNTIFKYSPNAAAQFVWGVTNDPAFKMNGRNPYDSSEQKTIFWNAVLKGKSYNLRWIEPWAVDLDNSNLEDEIRNAAVLFSSD